MFMNRFRLLLLLAMGFAVGMPVGWCLRGRSVAAKEAALQNMLQIEKAKQDWGTATNFSAQSWSLQR